MHILLKNIVRFAGTMVKLQKDRLLFLLLLFTNIKLTTCDVACMTRITMCMMGITWKIRIHIVKLIHICTFD